MLGFEYGYSWTGRTRGALGSAVRDFANAAQVIIDQFIVSAEDKWKRLSGWSCCYRTVTRDRAGALERSMERSCALRKRTSRSSSHDAGAILPSAAAQVLRPGVSRWSCSHQEPVRLPQCSSSLEDFASAGFQRVIPERARAEEGTRVLLCTGRCLRPGEASGGARRSDIAIVRIEQLYPLPDRVLRAAVDHFDDGTQFVWCKKSRKTWAPGVTCVCVRLDDVRALPVFGVAAQNPPVLRPAPTAATSSSKQELLERALPEGTPAARPQASLPSGASSAP